MTWLAAAPIAWALLTAALARIAALHAHGR